MNVRVGGGIVGWGRYGGMMSVGAGGWVGWELAVNLTLHNHFDILGIFSVIRKSCWGTYFSWLDVVHKLTPNLKSSNTSQ